MAEEKKPEAKADVNLKAWLEGPPPTLQPERARYKAAREAAGMVALPPVR